MSAAQWGCGLQSASVITRMSCCAARIPAERASFFPGLDFVWWTTVRWASLRLKGASQSAVPSSEPSSTTSHSTGQWVWKLLSTPMDQFDCRQPGHCGVQTISVTATGQKTRLMGPAAVGRGLRVRRDGLARSGGQLQGQVPSQVPSDPKGCREGAQSRSLRCPTGRHVSRCRRSRFAQASLAQPAAPSCWVGRERG